MYKARKNSLSPCYSTSNKENVQIDNIPVQTAISFRTLDEARKKKNIHSDQPCKAVTATASTIHRTPPGHEQFFRPSYTPAQVDRRSAKRDTEKSIEDFRSSLKSKEKQMGSLQSQVNTLNSTISLLKDQLNNLKSENSALQRENKDHKRAIAEKNKTIQKLKKDSQQQSLLPVNSSISSYLPTTAATASICQRNTDYDEVNEKLNELEEIQNRLLLENEELKKKENLNRAMFRNMKILIDGGEIRQIGQLLAVLQDEGWEQKENYSHGANNYESNKWQKKEITRFSIDPDSHNSHNSQNSHNFNSSSFSFKNSEMNPYQSQNDSDSDEQLKTLFIERNRNMKPCSNNYNKSKGQHHSRKIF